MEYRICERCGSAFQKGEECRAAECRRWRQKTKYFSLDENKIKLRRKIGIPKRYLNCNTKDFPGHDFSLGMNGVFLHGKINTGKTHWATIAISEWAWTKQTTLMAAFVTVRDFILEIKEQYSQKESEYKILKIFSGYGALVLDDLGTEYWNDWSKTIILSLIGRRYENCLPTIITSNLSLEEIFKREPRIGSRISSYRQIHMKSKVDWRKNERDG